MTEVIERLNNWLRFSNLVKENPIQSQVMLLKVIREADEIIDLVKLEENIADFIIKFLNGLINFNISRVFLQDNSINKYLKIINSNFYIFSDKQKTEIISLLSNLKFKWVDILPDLQYEILNFYFIELKKVKINKILDKNNQFDNEKFEQLKKNKENEIENIFTLTKIIRDIGCSYLELPDLIKQKYRCFISMYVYPGIKLGFQLADIRFLVELNKIKFDEIYIYGNLKATLKDNIPQIISIIEPTFYSNNQTEITENNILTILELSYKIIPFEENIDYLEFNEILHKISKMLTNLQSRNIGFSVDNKDKIIRILKNVYEQYNLINLPSEREVFVKKGNEIKHILVNLVKQYKINLAAEHEPLSNRISFKIRDRV